ncbi:putative fucose kinase [Trypanosoma grayi]|uniref:putative fucose kinase n=1 Tax=Trypanosoma grayi TaxID=71804 RepID=UPI0004F45AF9|nr:putative fucose kinase [Trypanosoma grayi]KEG07545.1 putative fucose kinase [Trypanosoma grayi]
MRVLLSVPLSASTAQAALQKGLLSQHHNVFFTSDPQGSHLGSGAGTAWLLEACYRADQNDEENHNNNNTGSHETASFLRWLAREPRIIVHSGGQSRRLPAYGPCGKVLAPIPVFRWSRGQTCEQTLLDLQMPLYKEVMRRAPPHLRTLVSCGDVLILRGQPLPPVPHDADVVCYGIQKETDMLRRHGVFFMNRETPEELEVMLQKPLLQEINEFSAKRQCVMDIGLWLLSDRAVEVLRQRSMERSGVDQPQSACGWREYDLYSDFGAALGHRPLRDDPLVRQLRVKVVTLHEARFFHYGTTTELIDSTFVIQNTVRDDDSLLQAMVSCHPSVFCQNACIRAPIIEDQRQLWIENSEVSAGWSLQHQSVITGVPRNEWKLHVPARTCVDVVPVRQGGVRGWVARPYGFNDVFHGLTNDEHTEFLGLPLTQWLQERGLSLDALAAGKPAVDIQYAALFPWCASVEDLGLVLRWMIAANVACDMEPGDAAHAKRIWEASTRYSANDLNDVADVAAVLESREAFRREVLPVMAAHAHRNPFYQLDLNHTAQKYAAAHLPLPERLSADEAPMMQRIHHHMFCARVLQYLLALLPKDACPARGTRLAEVAMTTSDEAEGGGNCLPPLLQGATMTPELLLSVYGIASKEELVARAGEEEAAAFMLLQKAILKHLIASTVRPSPRLSVYSDQIVWGRGPARIDLSGGWTDTPPYSILCGGNVVNIGINLNGQPPLHVYVKSSPTPSITLRSIDLGAAETLSTYEELRRYDMVGSPFSIPKAALALAGFLPEFGAMAYGTLEEQLQTSFCGKGLEITLLVAIPAGSGLGTSSLVAATVLSALSDYCGLGWDAHEVGRRTLALEQLLTTGGGWQDQYGGLFRGLKLLQSTPGFSQSPTARWLPEHLMEDARYAQCHLLYYTGITRTAKVILADIVRGMFLNSASHLGVLAEMRQQALDLHDAMAHDDFERYGKLIAAAWDQNKRLDAGTCPPPIAEIISRVEKYVWGLKLAGAGGGGYLYMVAKDTEAARCIREELTEHPPNATARFVEMSVSHEGIQVSRS